MTEPPEGAGLRVLTIVPGMPGEGDPALRDVWLQTYDLMMHVRSFDMDESAVWAQQYGMIRDGCFLMPSPFPGRQADLCSQSWFHEHQFYHRFDAGPHGAYFWISGLLDRGYRLDTIWFPARGIAVANYPSQMDAARLERFLEVLARVPGKSVLDGPPVGKLRGVVTGFVHFMHVLWNELPALSGLAVAGVPESAPSGAFSIGVLHEPFGPATDLFPELTPWLRLLSYADVSAWNDMHGLVHGLGSRRITQETQARVLRVATGIAGTDALARQAAFKAAHGPVFWLSVKPPKRTLADQPAMLAGLIHALRTVHPNAGFILDGASLPWDFPANLNYPPWFHDASLSAVRGSAVIINMILAMLGGGEREHVVVLNGLSVCEEVTWGNIADFYICHGGTMQNKIGWLHRIPGFTHSNLAFIQSIVAAPPVVVDGPPCFYASADLIRDDDTAGYSALELDRKDQNYRLASLERFVEEVGAAVKAAGVVKNVSIRPGAGNAA